MVSRQARLSAADAAPPFHAVSTSRDAEANSATSLRGSTVVDMRNLRDTSWNGWVFLAGFLSFALLRPRLGVVPALLVGAVLAGLIVAGQAAGRRSTRAAAARRHPRPYAPTNAPPIGAAAVRPPGRAADQDS